MPDYNWRVKGIFVYPVKSCAGVALQSSKVIPYGFKFDRQFMFIHKQKNVFVAQRGPVGIPQMCMIKTAILENDSIELSAPGMGSIIIYPEQSFDLKGPVKEVTVWKSVCEVLVADDELNRWVNECLGQWKPGDYELVQMSRNFNRQSKQGKGILYFADGYPFLIVSEESLRDLNSRLTEPVPMNRFRPNIVIGYDGPNGEPYVEDRMDLIEINKAYFEGRTLCIRCMIPTTDQNTGVRAADQEPFTTLQTYRFKQIGPDKGPVFARNYINLTYGEIISVGDMVNVSHWQE